ncbi:MAG: tol-pal system YbgF family protein [Planctomycetaceae bacterium]
MSSRCRYMPVLLLMVACATAAAQEQADKIVIRRGSSQRETTYEGRVLDYLGGIVRFRLKTTGNLRQFKAEEVVTIEAPQSDSHRGGRRLLKAGKLEEAIASLEVAARDERRDWVRRDILATLTQANLQHGTRLGAAAAFVRLTDSDPKTHHSGVIPLWWSNQSTIPAAQRKAREWLASPNYSARLIAASILMSDPSTRREATRALEQIAKSGRPAVIDLARVQQWRTRLVDSRRVSDAELKAWRGRLRSMKPSERAGAWFLLGRAYEARLEHERAAIAFLWLPLVHSDDHFLTAEASLAAAKSLQEAGRFAEAEATYRDTGIRYPNTPFGKEARAMLKPKAEKPQQ